MMTIVVHHRSIAMKAYSALCCAVLLAFASGSVYAQQKRDRKGDERFSKIQMPAGITDRAGGAHTKSNIGSYFVNTGKLYAPDNYQQGPTFEWPIGSTHEYVYRANPYLGVPGNVIQGRYRNHTEWEAAAGYNNRASVQPAFSDRPFTWPASGWPVKDASGNPIFVSNQDSYCAYNDSLNTIGILNLQINQTGYAFSQKSVRDMVIYIFDVTNRSTQTYDSLFFGIYADISCGGSDELQDYGARRMAFDRSLNRVYLYKAGGAPSYQWSYPSGYFGIILLQSPKVNGVELGITDWHYNLYADDLDQDRIQYGILSSSPELQADKRLGANYFHPGANAPNMHYDDPETISPAGDDVVSTFGSGPYTIAPGDTLRFITAWVAAGSVADMDRITANAYKLLATGFATSKPPEAPKVTAVPDDRKVHLTWDNRAESSRDNITNAVNFEGYHIYKSVDKGQHWDQIDRNAVAAGPDPVPLTSFDKIDGMGTDTGLQYSYIDSNVTNGYEYWYSVTGYTKPDSDNIVLESPLGRKGEINVGVATPRSSATGRTPVAATAVQHGAGTAKVVFSISPLDVTQSAGLTYNFSFSPVATVERGSLRSVIQLSIDSNGTHTAETFSLSFSSPTLYVLRNNTAGTVIDPAGSYSSGTPILFEGLRLVLTDTSALVGDRPKQGDSLLIRVGVQVVAGTSGMVLPLRPFAYGTSYATSNGLIFLIQPADTLASSRLTYLDKFSLSTVAAQVSPTTLTNDLAKIKVVPNPYLVSSRYEQEFGILRKEPERKLKFNNLPAVCTIYIFSMSGDQVKTIQHNSDNGTETWDLRADGNREIAPGVYIYQVKTDNAEMIGRFAVIK